jgi:signal peptidase II
VSSPSVRATAVSRLWRPLLLMAVGVLLLDQATKLLVRLVFAEDLPVEVTGFFNLVLAYNRGVSFSLFTNDSAAGPYIFVALSLAIAGGLVWWAIRQKRILLAVLAGAIAGGALGNIIDRIYLGAVVDFLDFHAFGWHWPAFNVADSAIVCSVLVLLADGLFGAPAGGKQAP